MANEEEIAHLGLDYSEFDTALSGATKAAEQFAQKVNSAFGGIKPTNLKEGVEGAGEGLKKAGEQVGSFARDIGSAFGEGGSKLGEFAEAAASAVGGLGAAFFSLRGGGEAAGKELEHVAEGAAKVEAGAAGASQTIGSLLGVLSKLGPVGIAAAAVGAATVGLFGYAVEKAEEYEKLAQASGTTYENFAKLADVGGKFDLTVNDVGAVLANVNNGFHEAAISSREIAERWSLLQERISVIQDRIKEGTAQRAEAEHAAVDQARESQHAIQQAGQARLDAEQRYQEAVETYQRHGRPLTRTEESDKAEKQRLREVETTGRALAEARRAETEAQHKAQDDARKADEERSARATAAHAQEVALQRFTSRAAIEQTEIRQRSSPVQRAFLAEGEAKGITDFAENLKRAREELEKFDDAPVEEKLKRLIEAFQNIPDGAEKTRLLTQNFGELATKIARYGADIAKALNPEELKKFGGSFPSHERMEQLAEDHRLLTENLLKISNAAVTAGGVVSSFFGIVSGAAGAGGSREAALGISKEQLDAQKGVKKAIDDGKKATEDKAAATVEASKVEIKAIDSVTGALLNQKKIVESSATGATGGATGAPGSVDARASARAAAIERDRKRHEGRTIEEVEAGGPQFELGAGLRTYEPAKIIDVAQQLAARKPLPPYTGTDTFANRFAAAPQSTGADTFAQKFDASTKGVNTSLKAVDFTGFADRAAASATTFQQKWTAALAAVQEMLKQVGSPPASESSGGSSGGGNARGGLIRGPGTGTSDSILGRLSAGEYVVRADGSNLMDAVGHFANGFSLGGLVHNLSPRIPSFAAGGPVTVSGGSGGLHPLTLVMPGGEKISNMFATPSAAEAMNRYAVLRRVASGGRRQGAVS
jgi:hypothetical protein